jgi:putative alpha-1,2-mannosidase
MAISKIIGSGLGTINSPVEFTSADNLTQLTLSSTDADANSGPNLDFYRNSASPADNDLLAKIRIQGKNDAGQQVLYSFIDTYALDVTDGTEDDGGFKCRIIKFYCYRSSI